MISAILNMNKKFVGKERVGKKLGMQVWEFEAAAKRN